MEERCLWGAFRMTGVGRWYCIYASAFLRAPCTLGQVSLRGQKSELRSLSEVCHIRLLSLSLRWALWS